MAQSLTVESGHGLVARLSLMDLPDHGPEVVDAQGLLRVLVMSSDPRGRYYAHPALLRRLIWWQETPVAQVATWRDELVEANEISVKPLGRCCYSGRPVSIVSILDRRRFRRFAGRDHIPAALRRAVFTRDGHRCLHCGTSEGLSLDHVIPWSLGGADSFDNLQTLCGPCNSSKGARV